MLEKVVDVLGEYGYEVELDNKNIKFILNRVMDKVKNYCNLCNFPPELETLAIEMCVETFVKVKELKAAIKKADSGIGNVTSVKTGDEQTSFDSGSSVHSVIKDYADRSFVERTSELNKFRKLRW